MNSSTSIGLKQKSSSKSQHNKSKILMNPAVKLRPSELLTQSLVDVAVEDYPMIIDFVNIKDNSSQVHCAVDIDKPLFHPNPVVVVFEDYAPFAVHEKKLLFRNNDKVARRIKVLQPDSPFFEILAPRTPSGQPLKQSKIAAGMEVCFIVRFKPQEVRDYSLELTCITEREKFLVPVRALGTRPRMNFPDEISFGACPVKSSTRKMILAQNIGSTVAKFRIRSNDSAFTCTNEDMSVEPGASQMIEVFFTPNGADQYAGELEVEYTKACKCYISMMGSGKNVDVSLSTASLVLESAYISLSSQKTLRIHNSSDISVKFSWKSFANALEEEGERERLHAELTRMEQLEDEALRQAAVAGEFGPCDPDLIFRDDVDADEKGLSFEARAMKSSLIRKYRNLRNALDNDPMLFVDDIFEISPVEGMVWAKSEIEITITFKPDTAATYTCFAYLDISGREDRQPLNITGNGIGPQAGLSFDILDIGDVFINSYQTYEVSIMNKGDIPARWNFHPTHTNFSQKFKFYPKEGYLEVNQVQPITIQFCSDILGEFAEYFRIGLQGSEEYLQCMVKGHVVGPTFHFDVKKINFGVVSYDIPHTTSTRLVNTSAVDMNYKLYVPQDGSFKKKEFVITPSTGVLRPNEAVDVEIVFTPCTVKVYEYTLAIDIQGVGEMITSIPINAECIVSTVRLPSKEIAFGECFLRHPYERKVVITNASSVVSTKFEILPQQQFSKSIAVYRTDPSVCVIPPSSSQIVTFEIIPQKLGSFKLPAVLNVSGSQEPPMQIALSCVSVGPKVEVDQTELRWGNIECLIDSNRSLMLTNSSLIPASMKIFLKMARSKFSLSVNEVTMAPGENLELIVTANLDDTVVCNEELHILVDEGAHIMIPLIAKGVGTSMFCQEDIKLIDFGVQLTNTNFERKITLENKGRRPQQLKWTNQTVRDENASRALKAKKLTRENPAARLPKNLLPMEAFFSVSPAEITLRPRTAISFVFKGNGPTSGHAKEVFLLDSKVGKERNVKTIITTTVQAEIVDPLLHFSERDLHFVYSWEKDVEPAIQRREITLTNKSALPLSFILKAEIPFNLSSWDHVLQPEQSLDLEVDFDPMYRDDRTTHTVDKLLTVVYRGHPQRDHVTLKADIHFPNLEFETSVVNFGCVLNDTAKTVKVRVTNWSKLDAAYRWIFVENAGSQSVQSKAPAKKGPSSLPPTQVFDIMPIRSILKAGTSEDIDFVMFGHTNSKFSNTAICEVEGGPEYKVQMQGEASVVSYSIDRQVIDYGKVLYSEKADQEIVITNLGKVPFLFDISMEELTAEGLIDAYPSTGKIPHGEKMKIMLRFRPRIPANFAESVVIRIAHFDPVRVTCYCQGIFAALAVTLPRHRRLGPNGENENVEAAWESFVATAKKNIMYPDPSTIPPDPATVSPLPPVNSGVPPVPPAYPLEEMEVEAASPTRPQTKGKVKEPSQIVLDAEMHRMCFCTQLLKYHSEQQLLPTTASVRSESSRGKSVGTLKREEAPDFVRKMVVANYYCDFGNVISGTTKKRVFKVMNAATAGPVSWVFDKQVLAGTGFSIDPDKVMKLPEGGILDVVIKFIARGKLKLGRQTAVLPIEIKNSPTFNLVISANVCLPDIEMSTDVIDFADVRVGCCKKIYVKLQNPSPVSATWCFKKPGGKDDNKFNVYPNEGTLRAGKHIVLCAEFVPVDTKKVKAVLPLKIDMNPNKGKSLTLLGDGIGATVKFDPPFIELGPVLPFSKGAEGHFSIINDGEKDIELFSLDFDSSYKLEEQILGTVDLYDSNGYYRGPVRAPGEPLPGPILAAFKSLTANADGSETDNPEAIAFKPPPLRSKKEPRDEGQHQDILVVGPECSGVSTSAALLANQLRLPQFSIDDIIREMAGYECDAGLLCRRVLKCLSKNEEATLIAQEEALLQAAEASKAAAQEAAKKAKKKKDAPEEEIVTPEMTEYQAFLDGGVMNTVNLAMVLRSRVSWDDCGFGCVIDGVKSKYSTVQIVCEAIAAALPDCIVSLFGFAGGAEGYAIRLATLFNSKTEEVAKLQAQLSAPPPSAKPTAATSRKMSVTPRSTKGGDATFESTKEESIAESTVAEEVEVPPPVGDEPWIDQATGNVITLVEDEVKSLEDEQKLRYIGHLRQYQKKCVDVANDVIFRISQVWDAATGLKEPAEDSPSTCLYYSKYKEVCALLETLFVTAKAPATEVLEGEAVDVNDVSIKTSQIYTIEIDGETETPENVLGIMRALLPAPKVAPPDADQLPPAEVFQIFRKPYSRVERKPIKHFEITPVVEGQSTPAGSQANSPRGELEKKYRWVIPAKSSLKFRLNYLSNVEGKHDVSLAFETVSSHQTFYFSGTGLCEVPKIQNDTRNVFMRRVKAGAQHPTKKYVSGDEYYSFGPLLTFKKPAWRLPPDENAGADAMRNFNAIATNMDTIRISNNGRYKCTVDFAMEHIDETPEAVFYVEPSTVDLEEGETKDVKIFAFPPAAKEYKNTLIACVSDNPSPSCFNLKCWGVEPTVEIEGPWEESIKAAEAALEAAKREAKADPKVLKELEAKLASVKEALSIDFDRILIDRNDLRTFVIKNTSLLPVAWEINLGSFADSRNIAISPHSGVVPAGASSTVAVTFQASEPMIVSGNFSLSYSDAEDGLHNNRSQTANFKIDAESYKIQAVSLTAEGKTEGGNEIEMGKFRVGDYVMQKLKVANLGKYQIGYAFNIRKASTAALLKIEPESGVISPNGEVDIQLTFCSPDGEVNMKGNKDVRVVISEPKTNEIVEEFPILINAHAVYNRFRMQPAKGISFGALRFDSEPRSKRLELKNEGSFEFTYVVCPALAEVNEIDMFDGPTLSAFAYATPPARRVKELGENYMSRLGSEPAAAAKGKKEPTNSKASTKGKPEAEPAKQAFIDPDNLPVPVLPENPLTLGAFSAFPRIGTVLPGQSVGIDIKFDPRGCDSVRERLRVCISGVDGADLPSQLSKSFEVSGESCRPAIVTDDVHAIFEEMEIVKSLADLKGGDTSGGSMKIEKIAIGKVVYAEMDKVLALGPVICGVGPVGRGGCVERIKITNPTKIDTRVSFKVQGAADAEEDAPKADPKGKGKDSKPAAKGKAVDAPVVIESAFTVQPEVWDIPPHEHRYVNIHFNPTAIKNYRSMFVAQVEDAGTEGEAKKGSAGLKLSFGLAGAGTMPCIAVEQPTDRNSEGNLVVDFNRVHVDRVAKRSIVLRNDGVMPATCLFDMGSSGEFVFTHKDSSVSLNPGERKELSVSFAPKTTEGGDTENINQIKISVLHNPFDVYVVKLKGVAYACHAMVEGTGDDKSHDEVVFPHVNIADGPAVATQTFLLRSRCDTPMKFQFSLEDTVPKLFKISPSVGHIAPRGLKEVTVKFSSAEPVKLDDAGITCTLKPIEYVETEGADEALWGAWDDSMTSVRPATEDDIKNIASYEAALKDYNDKVEAEKAKGKKAKPVGPPPEPLGLVLVDGGDAQMVQETVKEPVNKVITGVEEQIIRVVCNAKADKASYECERAGEQIHFRPTFMFQSTYYKFTLKNTSMIDLPIKWNLENVKRKGTTKSASSRQMSRMGTASSRGMNVAPPCPYSIEPEDIIVPPQSEQVFSVRFLPQEVDDYMYLLRGDTLPGPRNAEGEAIPLQMYLRGEAKRPVCHFEIKESPDYLLRRPPNMKNEVGLNSPIETGDIRVVEVESIGLRCRNTFRFSITNPTSENYEFQWETTGDPSPFWRCALTAGIIFSGKQTEMIFEYLPEEEAPAESFFKFKLPNQGLEQLFLFAGKVIEPRVAFSTSKVDFHNVMLEGEGGTETIYIENPEHIPFNFVFDKMALQNLEGPAGPILDVIPRSGTVAPNSRMPVELLFKPHEEVEYNMNIICDIRRKPNKLSLNVKGEGYAVHPLIQLEQSGDDAAGHAAGSYITLRPVPHINYADFGAVQVLDSITKTFVVTNNGKFNFDYIWNTDVDSMSQSMLALSGGKMGGTLHKGEKVTYNITFAPTREMNIDGTIMSFTVAGKYVYKIMVKGMGVQPAVRFSFMHYDFGNCFITSPGGSTVIEETTLRIVNHDPVNNIGIECNFQKTRALWCDCPPSVLEPGGSLDVPIRFAPRDVKDYIFVVPFTINNTGKINVNIVGKGIYARLELQNAAQRRTNFGVINVGSEAQKSVVLVNRSKRALPVQLIEENQGAYGGSVLAENCVNYYPTSEFTIPPRDKFTVQLNFSPNRRIATFNEDLLIRYAGITRKLITVSGKAQGAEVALDTDSLPFGTVVIGSRKVKKLSLENSGDLSLTFQWIEGTFGPHFSISPLSGKLAPGNEIAFDVTFKPAFEDPDIRQEKILLAIPGMAPLQLTCAGVCIAQPTESIQELHFESLVRKGEEKTVSVKNPTDKDWYVTPTLMGSHWRVPHEFKVPAKGTANLPITFYPLTMCPKGEVDPHKDQLFMALPDGTAHMYMLSGYAGPPESCGVVQAETPAKKHVMIPLKMTNWLSETQKFRISIDISEKPSPATYFVAANVVEIAPHGVKEFQLRFSSFVEGTTKAKVTFTNPQSGEYFYYDIVAKATSPSIVEEIAIESPVRQSARFVIGVENPLPRDAKVSMGSLAKPAEWWTCDCPYIRLTELVPISGNPEGSFELEYRPLTQTKHPQEHLLVIMTQELGTFKYKVTVTATPTAARQTLRFEVPLGSIQTESFLFKTYNRTATTFTCAVKEQHCFDVAKTLLVPEVSDWDGAESRLGITFEPSELGEVHDLLTITSAEGGTYECELIGCCVPPLPLGPYNFTNGSSVDIPFRNCFNMQCKWTFVVDVPAFQLSAPSSTVNAKSDAAITVSFRPQEGTTAPVEIVTGKLFIQCENKPEVPPWIVYLRGKKEAGDTVIAAAPAKGKK